jgi:mRNA interferase MazF
LSQTKLRPTLALADAGRGDWILCQITSNAYGDPNAIGIDNADFASGSLRIASYVRPGKLFTASSDLMVAEVGKLLGSVHAKIVKAVIQIIERPATPQIALMSMRAHCFRVGPFLAAVFFAFLRGASAGLGRAR